MTAVPLRWSARMLRYQRPQVGRRPVEQPADELVDVPAQQRGGVLALEVPVDGELLEAALEVGDQVVERDPPDDPAQDVVVHAAQVRR